MSEHSIDINVPGDTADVILHHEEWDNLAHAMTLSEGDEIWYRLPDEHHVHHALVDTARENTMAVKRIGDKSLHLARTTSPTKWLDPDLVKIIDHKPSE